MEYLSEILLPILIFAIYWSKASKNKNGDNNLKNVGFFKFLKNSYRMRNRMNNAEKFVWEELLNLHKLNHWSHSVFETEKQIESVFAINKTNTKIFLYAIFKDQLLFKVVLIENFPIEHTTNLFILATHFNNNFHFGRVVVNTKNRTVEFISLVDLDIYSLLPEKISNDLSLHFGYSCDVYWGFNKYLETKDEPALIFADFLIWRESELSFQEK
ncbi:MAG: hypothetical protein RJA76_481 [Bacteroidota bacterium]|jgi:hypothetical protein